MQDALAGYLYLISRGFQAHNITLIGDSSGAHLMLGLARYLAEWSSTEHAIGMPGALMLVSVGSSILLDFHGV
jgi:acetyl esterase/lipase